MTFTSGTWFLKDSKTDAIIDSDGDKGGDIRIEGLQPLPQDGEPGFGIGAPRTGSAPTCHH